MIKSFLLIVIVNATTRFLPNVVAGGLTDETFVYDSSQSLTKLVRLFRVFGDYFKSSVICHSGYIYFVTGQKDSEFVGDFHEDS